MSESQKTFSTNVESTQLLKNLGNADFYYTLVDTDLLEPFAHIGETLWNTSTFSKRERELIILKIASEIDSAYIWTHHTVIALNNNVLLRELTDIIEDNMFDNPREDFIIETVFQVINNKVIEDSILNKTEIKTIIAFVGFYKWVDTYTKCLNLSIGQREW